jgi:hypothetical protein
MLENFVPARFIQNYLANGVKPLEVCTISTAQQHRPTFPL